MDRGFYFRRSLCCIHIMLCDELYSSRTAGSPLRSGHGGRPFIGFVAVSQGMPFSGTVPGADHMIAAPDVFVIPMDELLDLQIRDKIQELLEVGLYDEVLKLLDYYSILIRTNGKFIFFTPGLPGKNDPSAARPLFA